MAELENKNMAKVLYLHGLGGKRPGPRTEDLEKLGHEVVYPELPHGDGYEKAVEVAKAHLDGVDLVIGSSAGGAVAMALKTTVPVLLLAPAWKMVGAEPTLPSPTTYVIHGFEDERVPCGDSEELMERNGAGDRLVLVSDGHSLKASLDLIVMTATSLLGGDL